MINYNLLKVFYVVAQEKNITKASEKLYISQPAVSSSIKELENQFNQQILVRNNKGVDLSSFGKVLFEEIKGCFEVLESLENMGEQYNALQTGILRIGSSSSNMNQILMEKLLPFVKQYPKIKIQMIRLSNENLSLELEKGNLDLIFIDYDKNIVKNFDMIKQFDIVYKLIGNKEYKELYPQKIVNLKDFPVDKIIMPSKNNKSRKFIEEFFNQNKIQLKPKYELDNYILLFDFVKNGLGLAFVNEHFYKSEIEKGEVNIIFESLSLPARKIVCLSNNKFKNLALDKFLTNF